MSTIATSLTKHRRLLRSRLNSARWVIAIGVLMLSFGVAPAGAASLVYLDAASNVWVASPDGAITRQLTTDANPDSLYLSPSMQDDGTVVVPNQDGFTRVLNADATKKSGPWSKPTPSLLNTPLNWADAAPTGNLYLAAQITAPFGGGPDPTVSIAALNAPGTSGCAVFVCQYDLVRPRFIPGTRDYTAITDGGDPVSYNGDFVRVVKADGTVVDWLGFTGTGTPDSDIQNVDVSRSGDRILAEITPKGITTSSSLTVLEETGLPPGGTVSATPLCSINKFAAGDARPRFSPDATQISFTEPDGLHIASAPTAGPNGTCVLANDHLVIPGARDADWSPYTLPTPPPVNCQATGTCPAPSCGAAGKPACQQPPPNPCAGSTANAACKPPAKTPCAGRTGKTHKRCQASLVYHRALRHCATLAGHSKKARRRRAACRAQALHTYKRSLKRIH